MSGLARVGLVSGVPPGGREGRVVLTETRRYGVWVGWVV